MSEYVSGMVNVDAGKLRKARYHEVRFKCDLFGPKRIILVSDWLNQAIVVPIGLHCEYLQGSTRPKVRGFREY